MGKIDELIQQYCPNGVEYKPIGEIGEMIRGKRFVHKDDVDSGVKAIHYGELYTHYGVSATTVKTYIRSELKSKMRYAHKDDLIIVGAGENKTDIGIGVAWLGEEDVAVHDACFILTNHKQNPVYLSYCLRTDDYHRRLFPFISEGKICSFLKDGLAKVEIPIPPLPVQEEIVCILDKYTELETELEGELKSELEMRQKQYEYYREKYISNTEGVKCKLGDVCAFLRGPFGGSLKKDCFKPEGYAVYEQQHAIYNSLDFRYFVDENKFKELKRFQVKPNDLIVSCSGTIGRVFIIPSNAPVGIINQALLKLTPSEKILPEFLKILFESHITSKLNEVSYGGAIKNVPPVTDLKTLEIILPSLDKQKEIVNLMNKFSALSIEISEGLPTEIKMRHQQYEYYRDKLLTFKRLEEKVV